MSRRRTPAEKKQLSYERGRRNVYGENDKASRKSIPLRKRARAKVGEQAKNLRPASYPPRLPTAIIWTLNCFLSASDRSGASSRMLRWARFVTRKLKRRAWLQNRAGDGGQ